MSDKLNIYQRLNEVRKNIEYIKKDKQVQNYKAVTHDQVTALVRKHLIDQGVIIYPNLVSTITVDSGEKTSKGTPILRVEAVYEFTIVNADDGLDSFKTSVSAHANDTGDKAPGKALSYAKKALVLKLFEIETGEDDESRYQEAETFNIQFYTDMLENAKTVDELGAAYKEAKASATKLGDSAGFRAITAKTNQLKAALEAKNANT